MNRIYKTIRHALTGHSVAVSEYAKGKGKCKAAMVGSTLICALGGNAFAMPLVYDGTIGTGKVGLRSSNNTSAFGTDGLPAWLTPTVVNGAIYLDSTTGKPATSGADLEINYSSGATPSFVIGSYSANGTGINGGKVVISSGVVDGPVYGALAHQTIIGEDKDTTSIAGNTNTSADSSVNLSDDTIEVTGGKVEINSTDTISGGVYGGAAVLWSQAGTTVTGTGNAESKSFAYAYAYAYTDNSTITASANTVTVGNNSTVSGGVYGGYVQLNATAAEANAGNASSSSDSDSDSYANADAYTYSNVYNSTVTANDNEVVIGDGSTVNSGVYGGHAQLNATAAEAHAGNAASAAYAYSYAYADASAIFSMITASANTVTVGDSSTVSGGAYGGYAQLNATAAEANAGDAASAYADASASASAFASAYNSTVTASANTVTVGDNSTVSGGVYGGYADLTVKSGTAIGGKSTNNGVVTYGSSNASINVVNSNVHANENNAIFNGVLKSGDIVGGYTVFDITEGTATKADDTLGDNTVTLTGSKVEAIDNIVTIGDNATFKNTESSLYGGFLEKNIQATNVKGSLTYDTFTGNTLNWSATTPATFKKVGNFENLNFTINPIYANTNTALISANDIVLGTDTSNISDGSTTQSKISVVGIHSGKVLQGGDKFILMDSTNTLTGSGAVGTTTPNVAQQGVSLLYDVSVNVDSKKVTATIQNCQTSSGGECSANNGSNNGPRVNPSLKSLSEGNLAGALLVTRGADVIADEALSAINKQNHNNGFAPFILISGGHTRYNTGSHIKSDDVILTGGLSYQQDKLTLGAFAESGWGNYDTYNSFSHAASVDGDGHTRYFGVGILGHYVFDSGFYTDGALRIGRTHNTFDNDLRNIATGEFANYKLKSDYVSAHIGGGYLMPLDDKNELDLSAKYLYSTVEGKKVNVTGDPIDFDRINSNRVRLNAKVNHQYNPGLELNAGLGYEYEFNGKAKATTYKVYRINAPSIQGSTGIASVGVNVKPTDNQNLTLNVDAKGYIGKREGIGGTVGLNYAF